jgi:hypothetical protein
MLCEPISLGMARFYQYWVLNPGLGPILGVIRSPGGSVCCRIAYLLANVLIARQDGLLQGDT